MSSEKKRIVIELTEDEKEIMVKKMLLEYRYYPGDDDETETDDEPEPKFQDEDVAEHEITTTIGTNNKK